MSSLGVAFRVGSVFEMDVTFSHFSGPHVLGHLSFQKGYRGVVARKDIPADTVLVRVHRSCCIGPDGEWRRKVSLAETDDSTDAQVASSHGLTNACLTVLRLLHEQGLGEASAFFAYLIVLPRDHRLPMEWNEAELELLQVRFARRTLIRYASRCSLRRGARPFVDGDISMCDYGKRDDQSIYRTSRTNNRCSTYISC